jgi:hypothetical protein
MLSGLVIAVLLKVATQEEPEGDLVGVMAERLGAAIEPGGDWAHPSDVIAEPTELTAAVGPAAADTAEVAADPAASAPESPDARAATDEGSPDGSAGLVTNRANRDALRGCAAWLRGGLPKTARLEVSVSVDETGAVTAASASAPREFARVAACIEARVKRWQLPARAERYSIHMPVILHGDAP